MSNNCTVSIKGLKEGRVWLRGAAIPRAGQILGSVLAERFLLVNRSLVVDLEHPQSQPHRHAA
jgi:hypothetical protein